MKKVGYVQPLPILYQNNVQNILYCLKWFAYILCEFPKAKLTTVSFFDQMYNYIFVFCSWFSALAKQKFAALLLDKTLSNYTPKVIISLHLERRFQYDTILRDIKFSYPDFDVFFVNDFSSNGQIKIIVTKKKTI